MKPKKWRVYYYDGTTFDDDIINVPTFHVVGIQEVDSKNGRKYVFGSDYYGYRFDRERWIKLDYMGAMMYLDHPGEKYKVLKGEMLLEDEWSEYLKRMKEDTDLPPRTGWYPTEPKE